MPHIHNRLQECAYPRRGCVGRTAFYEVARVGSTLVSEIDLGIVVYSIIHSSLLAFSA